MVQHILDARSAILRDSLVVQVGARLKQTARDAHGHLARALHSLVVGAAYVGHAVGGGNLADSSVADDYAFAALSRADDGAVGVDLEAVQANQLAAHIGQGAFVVQLTCSLAAGFIRRLTDTIIQLLQLAGSLIILGIHKGKVLPCGRVSSRRSQEVIHSIAGLPVEIPVIGNPAVLLGRRFRGKGNPQGHQLRAGDQLIHNIDLIAVVVYHILFLRIGIIVRILHHLEPVDHVLVAVGNVAHGVNAEVAHAGQAQLGIVLRAVKLQILVAQQEEPVTLQHAVHAHAGGVEGSRGHVQVDGTHLGAIADLGGGVAAPDSGAVAARPAGGVDGFLEDHPLGLVARSIDIGDVVANDIEVGHVSFESADSGIHCSSHAIIISFFASGAAALPSVGREGKAS